MIDMWPTTWTACIQILKNAGYKEPVTYYICLDRSHPNLWSTMTNPVDICQYCEKAGLIPFHYLKLTNKVERWCSSEAFCHKMTAHWRQKERWINGCSNEEFNEIWDGKRFSDLSWFWDPTKKWLLPVRCTICSSVVSADIISSIIPHDHCSFEGLETYKVECPHCYAQFDHSPQYANGDPRNIALIGHWDGWQPFSTSIKHSCGKIPSYKINRILELP